MNTEIIVNQILVDRKITQGKLAEAIDVHRVHLCGVISGKRKSNPVERKISQYLNVPEAKLFPNKKKRGQQAARTSGGGSVSRQKSSTRSLKCL